MMATNTLSPVQAKLKVLMRDFGYRLDGTSLVSIGVRGFTEDRIIRRGFRSHWEAAEYLIPIIHQDSYWERWHTITRPTT